MQYLAIRNPGVADYSGLTLLGVSTTRNSGCSGTIGTFGSGSKLSIALLLRYGIEPIICCGKLKMRFFTRSQIVKMQVFNRVCVEFSGTDLDGRSKTSTEDLGFVLEWGTADWTKPEMALREFISNAIDGSIVAGESYKSVNFEIVDSPRAKSGYTTVYLPYVKEVEKAYSQVPTMFLHFSNPELLESKCLPKRDPSSDKVLIYKKGVLAHQSPGNSIYDYNLGNELTLDESRNAHDWDARYSVAKALRNETPEILANVIKGIILNKDVWEANLDADYLRNNQYDSSENQEKRKAAFREAWVKVAGPKGIVSSGSVALSSFVLQKGWNPVHISGNWATALESYEVPSESLVLTKNELEGKVVVEATQEMIDCTRKVWNLFDVYNLTNGKPCPQVKGFTCIMEGGAQTYGYYIHGGDAIYLHTSLGGKLMFKAALEECVHYATGSVDGSRDLQDILFNLITEIAF